MVPVQPGTTIFTNHNFNLPEDVVASNDLAQYEGNVEPERHAKQWMRKKYGINCNKAGNFLRKYNFRFLVPIMTRNLQAFQIQIFMKT